MSECREDWSLRVCVFCGRCPKMSHFSPGVGQGMVSVLILEGVGFGAFLRLL